MDQDHVIAVSNYPDRLSDMQAPSHKLWKLRTVIQYLAENWQPQFNRRREQIYVRQSSIMMLSPGKSVSQMRFCTHEPGTTLPTSVFHSNVCQVLHLHSSPCHTVVRSLITVQRRVEKERDEGLCRVDVQVGPINESEVFLKDEGCRPSLG